LEQWRLPQTFEPYYPSRLLQGQSHGLGLFLVQTVVLGHRGQATARRTGRAAITIDFLLPA
ncbi:MAG: sensor histidine kinase, partial [Planctomycetes bacterium]|nr:sensor histidine kinase [Planctomycetota bacterium]